MKKYYVTKTGGLKRQRESELKRTPIFRVHQRKGVYRAGRSRIGGYYGRYSGKNPELKFFDTTTTSTVSTTGVIETTSINLIPQGVTENSRVGRKCVIKSIYFKCLLFSSVTVQVTNSIQLALVWDKQANGADAAYTDIWEANLFNSFINLANSSRFRILKTFRVTLKPTVNLASTTNFNAHKLLKYYKKCNIPLEFDSTTGAITEVKSNNLAWYAIASSSDGTATLAMTTRIRFSDGS